MKHFFKFVLRSLPLVIGLILTLTALAFLVGFANSPSLENFEESEFTMFVVFSILGIPTLLFGIDRLALSAAS